MSDIVFDRMLFDYLEKKNDQSNVIARLSAEVERLRLTDEEREAISEAVLAFDEFAGDEVYVRTLRGLLERMR